MMTARYRRAIRGRGECDAESPITGLRSEFGAGYNRERTKAVIRPCTSVRALVGGVVEKPALVCTVGSVTTSWGQVTID